jgi:hypothetical protein
MTIKFYQVKSDVIADFKHNVIYSTFEKSINRSVS